MYSIHEPGGEWINKGESPQALQVWLQGQCGGWFVGIMTLHGKPHDGHTMSKALAQVCRIAKEPEQGFVDIGYRGHGYQDNTEIHVERHRRDRTARSLWRWMKRQAAIEPGIGHLKREHRMDRNQLQGKDGDCLNAILSAAGMNFGKLLRLKHTAAFWRRLFLRPKNCLLPFFVFLSS